MQLAIEELTPDSFASFGRVVDVPDHEPDAMGDPWRWWAQTAVLERAERRYAVGYLQVDPGRGGFDWAERHSESEEMVIPVHGELLLYVAAPEPRDFRVFRVRPGQALILAKGVWHGAPLASGESASALVLLAERTGELDTDMVHFEELTVKERR
jgi:ureidoglycolate lyase